MPERANRASFYCRDYYGKNLEKSQHARRTGDARKQSKKKSKREKGTADPGRQERQRSSNLHFGHSRRTQRRFPHGAPNAAPIICGDPSADGLLAAARKAPLPRVRDAAFVRQRRNDWDIVKRTYRYLMKEALHEQNRHKRTFIKNFCPTAVLSSSYLLLGHFCNIPHILLFCILGTFILVPIELGIILKASKSEYGRYSLESAFEGQEKSSIRKGLIIALVFFAMAGLLSAFIAPIEDHVFAETRSKVLNSLPRGFDWTDYEYLKTFSKPMLIITCAYYGVFNVLIGPITEELFFRGYLTSHYERQKTQ